MNRKVKCNSRGFTLVELLIVIAIISMLVAMGLPGVQMARASARRAQCKSNLLQIVLATQNFEMAKEHYPAGVVDDQSEPIRSSEERQHHSWTLALLPFLDEQSLHGHFDQAFSVYDEKNQAVREITVPLLGCPSQMTVLGVPQSSYAACHHDLEEMIASDNHGVFYLNSSTVVDDVRDGLSHTIFFGEKVADANDLGWLSGTRATLRNTGTPINIDPWRTVVSFLNPDDESEEDGASEGDPIETKNSESKEAEGEEEGREEEQVDEYEDDVDPYGYGGDFESDYVSEAEIAKRIVVEEPLATKTEASVGGFGSRHSGGAHLSFGDGRIQFVESSIDHSVLQQLGHRDDGKLLDPADYRE